MSVEEQIGSVSLIKSGTDFCEFSDITVNKDTREARREIVQITNLIQPDAEINELVVKCSKELNEGLSKVCGHTSVELEGRMDCTRTMETNIGNWITDVINTEFMNCDLVILNSGAIRCNEIFPVGDLTFKNMSQIIPMDDKILMLRVPGSIIFKMLENALQFYPNFAGRYPQTSGINIKFDSSKKAGERLIKTQLWCGEEINADQMYNLVTSIFIAKGKDGFDCLLDPQVECLTDEEDATTLHRIIYGQLKKYTVQTV